jgi:hypothetical protein
MFLWVFFKFPALKLSRQEGGGDSEIPFGMIFAALMCAMMLGSLFFTYYSSLKTGSRGVVSSSQMLTATLFVASGCFILPVLVHDEAITFWCFCVFEVCCGIYFPSIAHLKEQIVEDGVRAKIYGILRIPLNIFVVLGLMLTRDGKQPCELQIINRPRFVLIGGRDSRSVALKEGRSRSEFLNHLTVLSYSGGEVDI